MKFDSNRLLTSLAWYPYGETISAKKTNVTMKSKMVKHKIAKW